MNRPKKPIGLTLISILYAIPALLLTPLAGFMLVLPDTGSFGSELLLFAGIFLTMGIVSATVCYGIWTLRSWGHPMAYWLTVISIPLIIIGLLGWFSNQQQTTANIIANLGNIAIDIWIIFYLAKPHIKALFGTADDDLLKTA